MSEKLCPFCGSQEVSRSTDMTGDGRPWPYIECEACGASAEPEFWNARSLPAAVDVVRDAWMALPGSTRITLPGPDSDIFLASLDALSAAHSRNSPLPAPDTPDTQAGAQRWHTGAEEA